MGQVGSLNLQIAKDSKDLGHGHLAAHFENVKETRDVLLNVKLHSQRLECHVLDPPHVGHPTVSTHLKFGNALKEVVHIVYIIVKNLLGRVLYSL